MSIEVVFAAAIGGVPAYIALAIQMLRARTSERERAATDTRAVWEFLVGELRAEIRRLRAEVERLRAALLRARIPIPLNGDSDK